MIGLMIIAGCIFVPSLILYVISCKFDTGSDDVAEFIQKNRYEQIYKASKWYERLWRLPLMMFGRLLIKESDEFYLFSKKFPKVIQYEKCGRCGKELPYKQTGWCKNCIRKNDNDLRLRCLHFLGIEEDYREKLKELRENHDALTLKENEKISEIDDMGIRNLDI